MTRPFSHRFMSTTLLRGGTTYYLMVALTVMPTRATMKCALSAVNDESLRFATGSLDKS